MVNTSGLEIGPGTSRAVSGSYGSPVGSDGRSVLVIGGAVAIGAGVIANNRVSRRSENARTDILAGNVAIYAARTSNIVKSRAAILARVVVEDEGVTAEDDAVRLISNRGASGDAGPNSRFYSRAGRRAAIYVSCAIADMTIGARVNPVVLVLAHGAFADRAAIARVNAILSVGVGRASSNRAGGPTLNSSIIV